MDTSHEEMANDDSNSFEVLEKSQLFTLMAELLDGWMETHGLELLERYYDHKKRIGKKKPPLQRTNHFYDYDANRS